MKLLLPLLLLAISLPAGASPPEPALRLEAGSVTQQQIAAYAANMSLLRVRTEQRVQRVQLHLALGGDFGAGS